MGLGDKRKQSVLQYSQAGRIRTRGDSRSTGDSLQVVVVVVVVVVVMLCCCLGSLLGRHPGLHAAGGAELLCWCGARPERLHQRHQEQAGPDGGHRAAPVR